MRSLSKTAAIAIALTMAAATGGTAAAQNQNQPSQQNTSPGSTSGPRGMMGYGFMGPSMMGPGMMGSGGMGSWMMGGNGSAQAMCSAMASHIEGRLGYIKAELKITDAQESLWNAYAAAARDNANTMIARCTAMKSQRDSQASLPDRLDQNEQLLAAQLDAVRAMNRTLKPLYASLSDSQKTLADQLFWSPMGMM